MSKNILKDIRDYKNKIITKIILNSGALKEMKSLFPDKKIDD